MQTTKLIELRKQLTQHNASFFLTLPLLLLVGAVVVYLCAPQLFELNGEGEVMKIIAPFRLPLHILLIAGAGCLLLFTTSAERGEEKQPPVRLLEKGTILFWSAGYANLLFGTVNSHLGLILCFLVGAILLAIRSWIKGERRWLIPRSFVALTLLYTLYEGATLLWAADVPRAIEYYQREVWMGIIPIMLLAFPPNPSLVRRFVHYALRITYLYLWSVMILYIWICLKVDNSLLSALTLNKFYYVINDVPLSPNFLLGHFGFWHYTYLGFTFLAPIMYYILNFSKEQRVGREWLTLALIILSTISYFMILQSRTMMLFFLFFLSVIGVKTLFKWNYKRTLATTLVVQLLLGITVLWLIPNTRTFFMDGARQNLWSTACDYLGTNLISGHGIGSSKSLLFPSLGDADYGLHFHNQILQNLLEGGLISALIMLLIPLSYLYEAARRNNQTALFLGVLLLFIMTIDMITCLSEYLIAMLTILCIMIHASPRDEKRQ